MPSIFSIYDLIQDGQISAINDRINNLTPSSGAATDLSELTYVVASATGNIVTLNYVLAAATGNINTINSNIGIITGSITVNLADNQILRNKMFQISETMGTNQTASGIIYSHTAGQTFAFGETGVYTSSGTVWKADANNSSFFPADVIAIQAITAGNAGLFMKIGTIRDDSWNWTIGGLIYLSITAGVMTQTQPSATDDCIQVLGKCFPNADTIQFSPYLIYITHT